MDRRFSMKALILGGVTSSAWGGLALLGLSNAAMSRTPGYPSPDQMILYVGLLVGAFFLAVTVTVICMWKPKFTWPLWPILGLLLLATPACVVGYGGGV